MTARASSPPPLPGEILHRVQRLASMDGRILLFLACAFALLAAMSRDSIGATAGCLAAGAALLELQGVQQLRNGEVRGLQQVIRSQIGLLLTIAGYAMARVMTFDPEVIRPMITDEVRETFAQAGLEEAAILPMIERVHLGLYVVVGLVSIAYQGSMALYYHRRREAVRMALETDPAEGLSSK